MKVATPSHSAAEWPDDVWAAPPEASPIPHPVAEERAELSGPNDRARHWRAEEPTAIGVASEAGEDAHALADALEGVAKRLRSGEIRSASGFQADMGDAAALTAALAAVLGLRR